MFVYMLVDNITNVGQAQHQGTLDWIFLEECRFGLERVESSGAVSDDGPPKVEVRPHAKPVVFSRRTDRATTALTSWMMDADPRTVAIEFCMRPDDVYMLRLDLTKAQLRSYQADYQKDSETVNESFQLDYEDITFEYWEQEQTNRDKSMDFFELKGA